MTTSETSKQPIPRTITMGERIQLDYSFRYHIIWETRLKKVANCISVYGDGVPKAKTKSTLLLADNIVCVTWMHHYMAFVKALEGKYRKENKQFVVRCFYKEADTSMQKVIWAISITNYN
jgi:hypothetical protein